MLPSHPITHAALGLSLLLLPFQGLAFAQPQDDAATTQNATAATTGSVAADFGSRTYTAYPIAPRFFGAEHFDSLHTQADVDMVAAAGFRTARLWAQIPTVFKTQTPDWSVIDTILQPIAAAGVSVMLQIHQTPPWLQPSGSTCSADKYNALPTNIPEWAQIAKQYVAHMDAKWPGLVTDYEIWNEPNTGSLCDATSQKLIDYQKLFAAAAPLMKQQAAADHVTIRVGGPATAGFQPTWVQALTTNPATYPYMDFMSYHLYLFTGSQTQAQWNTTYNGIQSVYSRTQSYGGSGGTYLSASQLMAKGKQPLGAHTPIYDSEYNLNWAFVKNCCSNDFTYSPVWNGLYIADMLDQVYEGAYAPPAKAVYFGANAHPYFCLIGQIDANMDCYNPFHTQLSGYPQYYLYQLLAAPQYLNLQYGGQMAKSISPSVKSTGLVVTAFYTGTSDSLLVINPTGNTYSSVAVTASNTGYTGATATLFQIVSGRSISSQALALKNTGGTSYSASISAAPYSVQAISIK